MRTMQTAGRAVVFSGIAVALGLALLVAMPLPFIRMLGVAGFLIPVVSIVAALTLQPVLLSCYGRRGTARKRLLRREPVDPADGLWARLARSIMARPFLYLAAGTAVLVAAAVPAFWIQVTPGSTLRDPAHLAVGPGLRPAAGGRRPRRRRAGADPRRGHDRLRPRRTDAGRGAAADRLARGRSRGGEGLQRPRPRFVDASRHYEQVIVAGRHDYGFPQAQAFVGRLRGTPDPRRRASRPASEVLVGGGPGAGRRLPAPGLHLLPAADRRRARPHLPAAHARVPLACCCRSRPCSSTCSRSARATGCSSSSSASGLGHALFGLYQFGQVEGWIPIFLFAMLFGLSMDYEVFLVTRMRESWDAGGDNVARGRARARAHGPDHHGGRDHHVRGVLRLRRRPDRRPAGVRPRPRRRDLRRRDDRALPARAEPDGDPRPLELVAARPVARLVRVAPSPLESRCEPPLPSAS